MRTIEVENNVVDIYNVDDFPYDNFTNIQTVKKGKRAYADIICSFDIETTTILGEDSELFEGKDFGFMYVWQFAADHTVCMGRTWDEWLRFLNEFEHAVGTTGRKIVIWCHNLSFEFQFFRNFLDIDEVFAKKERSVIYCISGGLEFRCSYFLTNMGLKALTQKTVGVVFKKQDGEEFDYRIKRFPDTPLTDRELGYCVCDVLGLNEALTLRMGDDNLATMPMTSTGYVRRDYREICQKDGKHMIMFRKSALNEMCYVLCKESSRGAISGSSHIWTDEILIDVDSFDIKSSYPFQMSVKYFPQGKFRHGASCGVDGELFRYFLKDYCVLMTISVEHLRLKKYHGIPYISKAKCRAIEGGKFGNGKVYSADKIGMTCTEIDFRIIEEDYYFDNLKVWDLWYAPRGMLSAAFRGHLLDMFQQKTDLEGGDKMLYDKFKNKINSSYGMMLTDIIRYEVMYNAQSTTPWTRETCVDIGKSLEHYYNSRGSFLSYQHGVWVLAHARDSLHEGMAIVGRDLVQVDTDSVKCLGDYTNEFDLLNQGIIDKAEEYDIKPYAMKGDKRVYLGVWEHEGKDGEPTYREFRSLGAKKYAYDNHDGTGVHITVAGLSKQAGKWLTKHGGLDAFTSGTVVPPYDYDDDMPASGRTSSTYIDLIEPIKCNIDGHEVWLGSNIGVRNVNYTFGITSEWLELIADGKIAPDTNVPGGGAYENLFG